MRNLTPETCGRPSLGQLLWWAACALLGLGLLFAASLIRDDVDRAPAPSSLPRTGHTLRRQRRHWRSPDDEER